LSGAEVKNVWSYTPTPPYIFMVPLIKHSDNYTGFFSKHSYLKRNQTPQDSAAKHISVYNFLFFLTNLFISVLSTINNLF
jgi:hypothetical protein